MTDINKLKQILDNAPEGATHYVNNEYCYRKETEEDFYLWANERWVLSSQVYFYTNSLSDLRTIVEQAEENQALKAKVAKLEGENNKLKMPIELDKRVIFTNEQFAAHNIKQRVAAIRDVAETFRILNGASTSDLLGYADKLEQSHE